MMPIDGMSVRPVHCDQAADRKCSIGAIDMFKRLWMVPLLAVQLWVLQGCEAPRPIETIRASGDHRFKGGNYAAAGDEYAEIVARYPGDWQAQYKLGLSMLKTNELAGARRALETARRLKPENQDVLDALAEVMYQQGDESHLFAFLRDRATSTQTIHAYLQLARYSLAMNDPDSAQTAIETAIQIDDGKTTDPYLEAASLAERLGHLDDAVRRLRQAYGISPSDRRVRERLKALGEDPAKTSPLPPGR
jgi:Flp pilus assembly protein TadD